MKKNLNYILLFIRILKFIIVIGVFTILDKIVWYNIEINKSEFFIVKLVIMCIYLLVEIPIGLLALLDIFIKEEEENNLNLGN
jgi:hypothetical protein